MRLFKVKVHAGARVNRLFSESPESYDVWVTTKAMGGRANATALKLIAENMSVDPKRLHIVKGAHSAHKIVAVLGV
jgi:uncharacterized protein YggU (UPF0235/DUF167 family)